MEVISPEIRQPPENTVTDLATSVSLTCTAKGHPAPSYEWYKDDILVPGETRSVLYIPELLPRDRGNYTCKAINSEGGIVSQSAKLDIQGRMILIIQMIGKTLSISLMICRHFAVLNPAEFIDYKCNIGRGIYFVSVLYAYSVTIINSVNRYWNLLQKVIFPILLPPSTKCYSCMKQGTAIIVTTDNQHLVV